jgi:hypothetical protein
MVVEVYKWDVLARRRQLSATRRQGSYATPGWIIRPVAVYPAQGSTTPKKDALDEPRYLIAQQSGQQRVIKDRLMLHPLERERNKKGETEGWVLLRPEKGPRPFLLTFRCHLDLHLGDCHGGVESL